MELRHQALEDERRRREQLEQQLQDETAQRQQLIEREVKMREKQLAQVCRSPSMPPPRAGLSCSPWRGKACAAVLAHLAKEEEEASRGFFLGSGSPALSLG